MSLSVGVAETPVVVETASAPAPPSTDRRRLLVVLVALSVAPLVASMVNLAMAPDWAPVGDWALIELSTREVGRRPVLLGAYSRFGWHHPGPALFYALNLPYRIVDGSSLGLAFGTLLLNTAWVGGIAVVAWRRGGQVFAAWSLVATGVFLGASGYHNLRDPWNPRAALIALALFVLLAWAVSCGRSRYLPVAVGVGSFVVQAHVGHLVGVGAILAVAVTLGLRARRSGRDRRPLRPAIIATVVVAAVLWLPPLAEQVQSSPGNVTLLAEYLAEAEPSWTVWDGLEVTVVRAGAPLAWLARTEARFDFQLVDQPPLWPGLVTMVALVSVTVSGWRGGRSGRGGPVRLAVLTWVLVFSAVLSTSRIEGRVGFWLVEWISIIGLLTWMCVALRWQSRLATGSRQGLAVGVAVLAVAGLSAVNVNSANEARPMHHANSFRMERLADQVVATLSSADQGVVEVAFGPADPAQPEPRVWGAGLVLQLEKRGYRVRTDPADDYQYGARRSTAEGRAQAVLTITTRPQAAVATRGAEKIGQTEDVIVYRSP